MKVVERPAGGRVVGDATDRRRAKLVSPRPVELGEMRRPQFPARNGWKVCLTCEVEQRIDQFHNNQRYVDRRCPYCRTCKRKKRARSRDQDLERMARYDLAHRGLPKKPRRPRFPATGGRKRCLRCLLDQEVREFNVDRRYIDGREIYCRTCVTTTRERRRAATR